MMTIEEATKRADETRAEWNAAAVAEAKAEDEARAAGRLLSKARNERIIAAKVGTAAMRKLEAMQAAERLRKSAEVTP